MLCAKGRGEDGGGEGKQSRAEPCLTPEEKKRNKGGDRRGVKRNRRAEKNTLKLPRERHKNRENEKQESQEMF